MRVGKIVAIIQTILHYLGWAGILLGCIALAVGNSNRGKELLIGGFSYIMLKYIIGFIFHLIKKRDYF